MQIFFSSHTTKEKAYLDKSEARHCIKVLRHQIGDEIFAIDGKGSAFQTLIESISKDAVTLSITSRIEQWGEKESFIRLGVSPLRLKDRFEWMIEKAVELGINEIIPVMCAHTVKYSDKLKFDRLNNILLSATKQCKRSFCPPIQAPVSLKQFLKDYSAGFSIIPYCKSNEAIGELQTDIQAAKQVNLLIGPEGGFEESEVALAKAHDFNAVSLGANRLRTETAAILSLGIVKMVKGY